MKKLVLLGLLLCCAPAAYAQDRTPARDLRREEAPEITAPSLTTATPEMWFYEQERARQEKPQYAVRRKAEVRAQQRQQRIAAMKWYGMSNSRPTTNATPLTSTYSPTWVSAASDPFRWHAARPNYVVARPGYVLY
jgi:hypothetical protein